MDSQNLVVIHSYANAAEAGFAQSLLEDAGIDATLGGESTSAWLSHVGTALGGVRLLVKQADEEKALQLLAELESEQTEFVWPEFDDEVDEAPTDDAQGNASLDPELQSHLRRAYIASLVGLALAPFGVPFYSLYLILWHRLFLPGRGGNEWRYFVAMAANLYGVYLCKVFWTMVFY